MFWRRVGAAIAFIAALVVVPGLSAGQSSPDPLHRPLDEILELNVRDGFVYYQALRQSRGALDRYIASLDVQRAVFDGWPRGRRVAFWLNAYNAFVLQTIVDRYPIRGRAKDYPPDSIRQIHGAFDKRQFRAPGRAVTLDDIEKRILPEFTDPRVYLALGMGAVGSGRLRSEAYAADRLEAQLAEATAEFVTTQEHVEIDRNLNELRISAIIGWHEREFVAAHGNGDPRFAARGPIERAALALVIPRVYPSERQFLERNEFRVRYKEFNWRLNDLTGGRR